jgi:ATP-dependent DNA helicase RecG
MVSEEQIRELIKQGESTTIEFKSCTNKISTSVYESVCAFLNREGGHLLIGVDDDGLIQGINENNVNNMIKDFINILNNPQIFIPTAFLSPETIKIDGKTVIYVNVPESSQVHRYKGNYYDRVNDADNDITQSFYLVDNLHLRKRRESSENEVFPYLAMSDFDDDTFKKMRNQISIHNPQHPWLYMEDEEILRSSFWRKDPVTNKEGFILAAIVLFGRENSFMMTGI